MSVEALVVFSEASRTYGSGPTAYTALEPTSCMVVPGARIALIGPSGSGKSTLLHLMAGLDEPTAGTVSWPAIGGRADLRPGPIAMIFQGPSLMPALTVVENVALPLLLAGDSQDEAHRLAKASLQLMELDDVGDRLPEEISGGQAQRVAVARAIAREPLLILADEPTGQLDAGTGAEVIDVLLAAAEYSDAGLVVSTHDPAMARRLAEQWDMADGRLRAG